MKTARSAAECVACGGGLAAMIYATLPWTGQAGRAGTGAAWVIGTLLADACARLLSRFLFCDAGENDRGRSGNSATSDMPSQTSW